MKSALLLSAAILTATVGASAQTSDSNLVITRTNAEDSVILAKDRPQSPRDIPVPKFVVKTKDKSFMMTIGGKISPIMGADLGNDLYNIDGAGKSFVTQLIPVPATHGHRSDFYIYPLNTIIDFQIVGLGGTDDQITGYIKLSNVGNSKNLKLNKAYLTWHNITAGMKSTLFEDGLACQPPTIDPQGPSGSVSTTAYEVSYKSANYDGLQFAIGIDQPSWYSSNGIYHGKDFPTFEGKAVTDYGDAEQIVPDVPMWIQYGADDYNRVRLSGIIRNFAYHNLVADKTEHMVGWGAMLSGNFNPVKPLILYYQAAYGEGIGAYLQDIAGMPLSFVPKNGKPGKMKASPMMGINIGLTYNISDRWQVNIMGSESRIWGVRDYAIQDNASNYKYALYAAGNVFYNITSYLQWGMEYVWGHRETWDKGGADDSRVQTQLKFTF